MLKEEKQNHPDGDGPTRKTSNRAAQVSSKDFKICVFCDDTG
jgi:hypothetical protein